MLAVACMLALSQAAVVSAADSIVHAQVTAAAATNACNAALPLLSCSCKKRAPGAAAAAAAALPI